MSYDTARFVICHIQTLFHCGPLSSAHFNLICWRDFHAKHCAGAIDEDNTLRNEFVGIATRGDTEFGESFV